jgi:hypothetical protein
MPENTLKSCALHKTIVFWEGGGKCPCCTESDEAYKRGLEQGTAEGRRNQQRDSDNHRDGIY